MAKGRPNQIGLEFFSINVNMFSDIKVRKLIKYQGGNSMSVYIYLLCVIYENGYYIKWDDDLPFIISEVTGFEENYISEVIYQCLKIGLFDKEMYEKEKVVTSKGIQNRYNDICKRAKRTASINSFSLITPKESLITPEENSIPSEKNAINSELMAQSKEKESKEKESKEKESKVELHTQEAEIIEAIEVANYQDTFRENLLRFKKEFPSEKRYVEIGIMFSKKKDEIEMLFDEFIKENEQSRKLDNLIGYEFLKEELKKYFFNWVRAKERNKEEKAPKQTNFQILATKVLKETNLNPYQ